MPDMESLNRAVEEARRAILDYTNDRWEHVNPRLDALIAAVSAKARAEERERVYEERRKLKTSSTNVSPWYRARSSEEAGNGV